MALPAKTKPRKETPPMANRFDDIDDTVWGQAGETAGEITARGFPLLRPVTINHGDTAVITWKVGPQNDAVDVTDLEVEALPDQGSMSWIRFEGRRLAEESDRIPLFGCPKPDRPASHADRSRWETWGDGRGKDPWSFRPRLPVRIQGGELDGKVAILSGDTEPLKATIGEVLMAFTARRRRPLARLTAARRDGDGAVVPTLEVVAYSENDDIVPGLAVKKRGTVTGAKPPANGEATAGAAQGPIDEIPFAPEHR